MSSLYISDISGESALLEMAPMGTDLTPGKTTRWLESKSDQPTYVLMANK